MNLKKVLFIYFLLILFISSTIYSCRCGGYLEDAPATSTFSFSILDRNGNDLIENNTIDYSNLRLEVEGTKVLTSLANFLTPYYISILENDKNLQQYNDQDYYLYFGNGDIDTLNFTLSKEKNECGISYYVPSRFVHNGIEIEESEQSNEFDYHYIIIK